MDELRGIAILLVLLDHSIISWAQWARLDFLGTLGVNIFFVISGYLICTILKNDRKSPNFFRTFYVRRVFRIWPLFLVICSLGLLAGILLKQHVWDAVPYYLTFTMNFASDRTGEAMASGSNQSWLLPFTGPTWSLAIEEQFYLFLPLLVWAVSPKRLPFVVGILCAIAAVSSLLFLYATFGEHGALAYPNFKNTGLRIQYLGFGVLLALRPSFAYALILGWLAAAAMFFNFSGTFEIIIALFVVWLVAHTIRKGPFFTNRLLARFGFLCFGLYLLHWPMARLLESQLIPVFGRSIVSICILAALFISLSYAAASLCFKYFEYPIQKLRTRFEAPLHASNHIRSLHWNRLIKH